MLDLDRITNPIIVSKGSYDRGTGKGCAMNVVSYMNGDVKITDYPKCSAPHLSRLVQRVNDRMADMWTGVLSPQNAVKAIELGSLTMGTSLDATTIRDTHPSWSFLDVTTTPEYTRVLTLWLKALGYSFLSGPAQSLGCVDLMFSFTYGQAKEAILLWRELAGLDNTEIDSDAVNNALGEMTVSV